MRVWKPLVLVLAAALAVGAQAMAQTAAPNTSASGSVAQSVTTSAPAVGSAAAASSVAAAPSAAAGASEKMAEPPAATKPSETAGSPAAAPTAGSMDGGTYLVRLRDLEQRIDELKEQIRRSHTRLSLLSETILSGGVGGARAEIAFINDMSSAFQLTQALFVLDGAVQYNKQDDTGLLASQTEIPIFSGSIPPGDHTLQVLIKLKGHGYGVFSYLQGYRFEVRSSHSFTVTEGKTVELRAVAFEKGDVTTPIEQRPAVRYVEKFRSGIQGSTAAPVEKKSSSTGVSKSISVSAGSR